MWECCGSENTGKAVVAVLEELATNHVNILIFGLFVGFLLMVNYGPRQLPFNRKST